MLGLDQVEVVELAGQAAAGSDLRLGAVGLALASGAGSWFELLRLRGRLAARLESGFFPWREINRLLGLAAAAALPAALLWRLLPPLPVLVQAAAVLITYAVVYLLLARFAAPEELAFWLGRFERRLRRR